VSELLLILNCVRRNFAIVYRLRLADNWLRDERVHSSVLKRRVEKEKEAREKEGNKA
jgi:hypothetical protein